MGPPSVCGVSVVAGHNAACGSPKIHNGNNLFIASFVAWSVIFGGHIQWIPEALDWQTLRELFTIAGGEEVTADGIK